MTDVSLLSVKNLLDRKDIQDKWVDALNKIFDLNIKEMDCRIYPPSFILAPISAIELAFYGNEVQVIISIYEQKDAFRIVVRANVCNDSFEHPKAIVSSLFDIERPITILSQCAELFRRVFLCLNDELGYLKSEVMKEAEIQRESMRIWLDKLTLLMVENDISPKEEEIASHMWKFSFGEYPRRVADRLFIYLNKKRSGV